MTGASRCPLLTEEKEVSESFQLATISPGLLQPSIALASLRAGALGILDFEHTQDHDAIRGALRRFHNAARTPLGIKLRSLSLDALWSSINDLPRLKTVLLVSPDVAIDLPRQIASLQDKQITVLFEATSLSEAEIGLKAGVQGIVAKGHEAGGRVGDETTFILLQRLLSELEVPVWAHGGVGLYTAAACAAAGAAGVILDSQLTLTRESPFPGKIKARIARMDGSETICLGEELGEAYRIYYQPGSTVVKELQEIELRLVKDGVPNALAEWRAAIAKYVGWESEANALLLGQDAAFAVRFGEKFRTVSGVLHAIRDAVQTQCLVAPTLRPLSENSPLAKSNGTRYPILQGPMTRVSDVPEFAAKVAEHGGLPFLALALLRGPEVEGLLKEARQLLGNLPWGVGILGFVPPELRQEQMSVVMKYKPPFALIAGGRADQANALEKEGIKTYLHVPSPGLLRMFVQEGARKFIFEGRECGGHVGPRTSFVLWEQMIATLLSAPELATQPDEFHIVFAGGIHDAFSASMVSVMAAPLAERGVRVGTLIGTAYLFTEESVSAGAIVEGFQEQALECRNTVLLTTGPGHATRCVDTQFASVFGVEKRRLMAAGRSAEEIRMSLEDLNLGRLRIASKGVHRNPAYNEDPAAPKLLAIDKTQQVAEGMYMIGQVAALHSSTCTIAELHHDISVEGSNRLQELTGREWLVQDEAVAEQPCDVAIVGMSCIMPKSPNLSAFWENILNKVNAVGEIPKERWDWELYYDPDPKARDKIYSRWGGFLDDIAFDPIQFGMPPTSLRSIEPSQLLTLEVVRAALEDSGYLSRPFNRERTSVILGAGGGAADLGLGYCARSFLPTLEKLPEFRGRSQELIDRLDGSLPEWTEDSFAGILTNVTAGRIANRFDLGGSNYTVDAACASSLAAVSLALKELEGRTSDMVIVGGVDTMQNPFTYLCFAKTSALSPRGRCRTFDETADGIAISEGIAITVLKRLADAERDGDRIYAVIKASGSSSDGKDRGLTAPRPEGQVKALKRAYAKAGISPATVGMVEAHGTGTVAGDTAEVQALTQVFSEAQASLQSCAIGSVKSVVGHTKCSAGAAGLIKTALALHHKVLPPTLGVDKPNPKARFPETPFFVNTEAKPWIENASGQPRRAGVSAFGFGGTNFHIVLEEYTGDRISTEPPPAKEWPDELFLWRADSRKTLLDTLETWDKALAIDAKPVLRDLAYTAWKQTSAKPASVNTQHLTIVATSVDDLRQKLSSARASLALPDTLRIKDPKGIYFSQGTSSEQGKLAFLFPGQGSQYPRMLQDLFIHFPEMRRSFEASVKALDGKLDRPLNEYVFPPPSFGREEDKPRQRALTQTNIAQPAIGAVSFALCGVLQELGLKPQMAAGHSYGEYVALAAAGAFDQEALIALSEARGRYIVEGAEPEPGTMAAIDAETSVVAKAIENIPGVVLANSNGPRQNVISGTRAGVQQAVDFFTAQDTMARMIPVACAFHSPLVAPAQARLAEFISKIEVSQPKIPVFSNTTTKPYPQKPEEIANLLVEHLAEPVEFVREIEAMYEAGARVFVEVGPRGVLTNLVEEILGERPKLAVASNQNGKTGLTQLLHMLGQVAVYGCEVKLDRLYRDRTDHLADLSNLSMQYGEKPLAPSIWRVNGARAVPAKEIASEKPSQKQKGNVSVKPFELSPVSSLSAPPTAQLLADSSHMPTTNGTHSVNGPTTMPSMPISPLPQPPELNGLEQLMTQFQQTMTHFLETQRSVMVAYLGAEPASAKSLPSPPIIASTSVNPPAVIQTPSAVPIQHPPAPAPTGPNRHDLTQQLLSIVSDRTGYPPEMLDLALDMEADLGIDSIKRVEILGTFQQSFTATGASLQDGLMEKLSGIRTLQGIVDLVIQHASPSAVPMPVTTHVAPEFVANAPSVTQITEQLLTIVSDRTGYPAEMLDLNLDLEADLGIDSIKRVEILGTFQQGVTASGMELPQGIMEQLSGIRTLQGILNLMFKTAEPAAPVALTATPNVVPPLSAPKAEEDLQIAADAQIERYILAAVDAPLRPHAHQISNDRVILITGREQGIAGTLAKQLLGQGYKVAVVSNDREFRELGAGSYSADLSSLESTAQLVALVSEQQGKLSGIVHLAPLEASMSTDKVGLGVKSLFHLVKAAGPSLLEPGANGFVLAATGMGGSFMVDLPKDSVPRYPEHGAIAGLIKTLALEWPDVRAKVLDLNLEESTSVLAEHITAELQQGDDLVELGYSGTRRITLVPVPAAVESAVSSESILNDSSVVLITGGARGITALAAKRLAEKYKPTLILVGRSPLPAEQEAPETAGLSSPKELKAALMAQLRARGETATPALVERAYARLLSEREVRTNLAGLHKLGSQVHYYPLDVRDPKVFGEFIDAVYTKFDRIDGVIHGAGLIEDRLILDKTSDSFDRVFDTKVNSALSLSEKLRADSLKFLIFFSSVSGRFGNRGQGDYAAANEVLNKLAGCLNRSWKGRVVAINWGPWDADGMVSEEVRKQFAARGVQLIPVEAGLQRLEDELIQREGAAEVVIGGAGWEAPAEYLVQAALPLLINAESFGGDVSEEWVRKFDPLHDLYLNDHRLDGNPVVPLAVATEFIAEAAARASPQMQVAAIRDLRLLNGVVIENGSKSLRIRTKPKDGGSRLDVEISVAGSPRIHYRAEVELEPRLIVPSTLRVPPLTDGRGFSMGVAECYENWLFHGPLFQGIERVDQISPSGVTALLKSSSPAMWMASQPAGDWLIDPLIFDGALQLMILWTREHWDMTGLPSGFQSYRRFAKLPDSPILCEMRILPGTGGQTIRSDLFFIDAVTGRLLALVEDMQATCSKNLNRLANKTMAAVAGRP